MSQRISLRDFQKNLSARLGSAQRGESARALLAIESGRGDHARWLLDLAESGEVAPLAGLTLVPMTKSWFAGIANIRGTLYSVVDFSAFRGGEPTPRNAEARLLLIGAKHGSNSALLVNRTLGLRPPESFVRVGTIADGGAAWQGRCYTDAHGQEWTRLRIQALLTDSAFLNVAA